MLCQETCVSFARLPGRIIEDACEANVLSPNSLLVVGIILGSLRGEQARLELRDGPLDREVAPLQHLHERGRQYLVGDVSNRNRNRNREIIQGQLGLRRDVIVRDS